MTNYSNPRIEAIIENWPMGFTRKVTAKFFIEVNNKGERAVRETVGVAKKLTYAKKMRIVDGDDGKTYIAALSYYNSITIFQGNMKFHHESFFPDNEKYQELIKLFY
jgi:hypothetical protein